MKKIKIIMVLSGLIVNATGQTNLDSLWNIWKDVTKRNSTRVEAYRKYIRDGFFYTNPDTAFILAEEFYTYAKKNNYPKAQAEGYFMQGSLLISKGDYSIALECYIKSLKICEKINHKNGISSCLIGIGMTYDQQGDYPKAIDYYSQSLKIAEQMGNQKTMAICLNNIGTIYHSQGNYPKALEYSFRSLKTQEQLGDQSGIASSLNNVGSIFSHQGNYPKGLDYYSQSLKIVEQIGDQIGIASSIINIGHIYNYQGNYPKGLECYLQSLKIYEQLDDQIGIATSLLSIGHIYNNQGNYPKGLECYSRSLKIAEQMGNQSLIANCLNNIGALYERQSDYTQTLSFYTKSLKIAEQIGEQDGIAISLTNIGGLYVKQEAFSSALDYCQKGYELAKTLGLLEQQQHSCECLYETYKFMHNNTKALKYLELINVIDDSLQQTETAKKLQRMEFEKEQLADSLIHAAQVKEYELENQQKQIIIKKDQRIKQYLIGAIALALLFFSVLVIILIYRNRIKKQELLLKETALEKRILNEKILRSNLNVVQEKLSLESKAYQELKNQLETVPKKAENSEYLAKKLKADTNWMVFMNDFNVQYKGVVDRLKKQFTDLTNLDLRIVVLTFMNVTQKETQQILAITDSGVKKAKTRVRKKLGLNSVPELRPFLEDFIEQHV